MWSRFSADLLLSIADPFLPFPDPNKIPNALETHQGGGDAREGGGGGADAHG